MSQVVVAKINPRTIIADYQKLLRDANYKKHLDLKKPVVIKINLSWTKFFPACSTPPWALDALVKTLLEDGFKKSQIIPLENRTVVTNVRKGSENNGWVQVLKKHGLKMTYLTDVPYKIYKPKHKLLVMNKIFENGIELPEIIFGANMIHLPTMKMHVFTTVTGAIKNYFGMLRTNRHFCHRFIHETVIDLLTIQEEIHPGIFALMDAGVVGIGSGPRAMKWEEKNFGLASADSVAIDAISAKMMGFNPLDLKFLSLGQKLKLGVADPKQIEIKGVDISRVNFGYKRADTFASRGQKLIYHGFPEWLEKMLLRSFIAPWSYTASNLYHDAYWYNIVGKPRLKEYFNSSWGKLFTSYLKK